MAASSSSRAKFAKSKCSSTAYKAASERTPESLQILRDFVKEDEGKMPIDKRGDTILHFLAICGNDVGLGALIEEALVNRDDLARKNERGDTPLHEAARYGQEKLAEIMLKKEQDLVLGRNNSGETPLYLAAAHGKKEVFALLNKCNSDCHTMKRKDGCNILHAAVLGECYSLAVSILELYPDLARDRDENGRTALHLLATKPSSFKSGSFFVLKDLTRTPFTLSVLIGAIIYPCIPPLYVESEAMGNVEDPNDIRVISKSQRSFFTKSILGNMPWSKEIDDTKQKHLLAVMLAKRLIEIVDWNHYINFDTVDSSEVISEISSSKKKGMLDPLIEAAKHGICELALAILERRPEAAESVDENGRNVLLIASEKKHRFLFDCLMDTLIYKHRMLSCIDNGGNTILHLAANAGTLSKTPGTLHLMTWEVFWFKRIKYETLPCLWDARNNDGMTAKEVFEKNHSEIRKEAEQAEKEISNSVLIVSALIGTVNFTAVLTIPGGFDSKSGLPVLLQTNSQELRHFFWYVSIALLASFFTLGTTLSIFFSRFHTEDFHVALPLKRILNSIAIFYSSAFSIIACYQAFILENSLGRFEFPLAILVVSCLWTFFIYMDNCFLIFDHMYYLVCYSLRYKSHEA